MRRSCLFLCAAAIVLLGSCGRRVIPPGRMSSIFADMFLVDEWIVQHYQYKTATDTSLVYDHIFKKYGYDFEDFDYSVSHYLNSPEKFQKIVKNSRLLLEKRKSHREIEIGEADSLAAPDALGAERLKVEKTPSVPKDDK